MATSRSRVPSSARPAARRTSGRVATRAAQSSNNTMMIVGGIAAAVALVLVISFAMGDRDPVVKPADAHSEGGGASTETTSAQPATPTPQPVSLDAEAREGTTPRVPPPKIDPAVIARAEALYQQSKQKSNDAILARRDGDAAKAADLVRSAWADFEQLRAAVEPYDDWYNEADFEGWAIPGEYVAYQRRIAVWDNHATRLQKSKTRR